MFKPHIPEEDTLLQLNLEKMGEAFKKLSNNKELLASTLKRAFAENNYIALEALISAMNDLNIVLNDEGSTVLHLAVTYNCTEIVDLLLKKRVSQNLKNQAGETPLWLAVKNDFVNLVPLLTGNKDALKDTLKRAITENNILAIKTLIAARVGLNLIYLDENETSALHFAAMHNRPEIARLLVSYHGAFLKRLNFHLEEALWVAAKMEHVDTIIALKDYYKGNTFGVEELYKAAKEDNFPALCALIEAGADINFCYSPNNFTLLHYAIKNDFNDLAAFLIAKGAKLDAKDMLSRTPFTLAAILGKSAVLKVMFMVIKIDQVEKCTIDACKYAYEKRDLQAVKTLVEGLKCLNLSFHTMVSEMLNQAINAKYREAIQFLKQSLNQNSIRQEENLDKKRKAENSSNNRSDKIPKTSTPFSLQPDTNPDSHQSNINNSTMVFSDCSNQCASQGAARKMPNFTN